MTSKAWICWAFFVSAMFLVGCGQQEASAPISFSSQSPTTTPAAALVGSKTCQECHADFYEKWSTSWHGLAMQPYTTAFAKASLTPHESDVVIGDNKYRAEIGEATGCVREIGPDGDHKYPIVHVLGGKNVFYFLTPLERGRLQVLPLAYDARRKEWLNTTGSAARGLMHFADEVLDWRAPQLTFNTSCYGCHVSQFASNYDPKTDSYHSVWVEPGISCETCHAGGGEHVKLFRDLPAGQKPDDIRIISTKKFSVEQLNALCAPCHAKSMPLTSSFKPGDRFFDNYDLAGPEQSDFYADGRDLGENYTYTSWRMSPCVKSGKLSCMHCHTSSGRYRFTANSNQACLPCHQQQVEHATDHTRHQPDSKGNQCVACHMPTTEFARMRRSDHSMRPPMPAATQTFKSPNACNGCHEDHDAAWADRCVREWRSRDYQMPTLQVAALVNAARQRDWTRLPEMLDYVTSAERDDIFATALIRLVRGCEDDRKWPALLKAMKDSSPLIRASVAEGLAGCPQSEVIAALLAAMGDEYRLVRVRAAASLAGFPPNRLQDKLRRAFEQATNELLALSRARPDDSASHYNLGNFHMARQEYDQAIACYERAFQLLPDNSIPLVNASLVHNAAGRNDKAEDCLRRALNVEPNSAAARLNLGLLLGEMGRSKEAEAAFRAAFEADPQSATAAYNLAVLLTADRLSEAIDWSQKAVQLRPQEPKYAYTLAFCLHQNSEHEAAIHTLRDLTDKEAAYADAYALLGRIYEEQHRKGDAIDVYRRAANNPKLPDSVRKSCAARANGLESP